MPATGERPETSQPTPTRLPCAKMSSALSIDCRVAYRIQKPAGRSAVGAAASPATGTCALTVVGELAAGSVFAGVLQRTQALRIMTGAPMPAGADTVYLQEHVERDGDSVIVGPMAAGSNVRARGEDV